MNNSGGILNTTDYEPFGRPLADAVPRQGYIGKEKDYENDLADHGVRKLDYLTGRFTSVDPLWEKYRGWNLYQYAGDNPLKFLDPTGLDWLLFSGQKVIWYGGKYGDKSTKLYSFKATSGLIGYQLAKNQDKKDVGPVPEGKYSINLKPDPNRTAKVDKTTGELYSNKDGGIEKIPAKTVLNDGTTASQPGWGTERAKLDPDNTTNTKGRNSFYLHDSQKGYSHGCIEVEGSIFLKLREFRKDHTKIEVMVDYPNNASSTNGGTKKMINIFFSIFLFSLLWDNNKDIIVSTDKQQYNNRETISVVIQNNSHTNKWSYIGLETRFNGEWEEIDLDILTNMQKTVKLHKIKKSSKSVFQYLPSKIDSVYFLNNRGEFRLKVTFGESPEKMNKEVYSLPIIINREISQINIK